MSLAPRVRFAPSPTGLLHVGNARTALYNWLFARNQKGTFVLRIEDTDKERSTKEYEESIYQDLKWMGLDWDEGPDKAKEGVAYRQSERSKIYVDTLEKLIEKSLAYRCFCTLAELKKRREEALASGKPPKYDNRCRDLTPKEIEQFQHEKRSFVWRFKVPENREILFKDLVRGEVRFDCQTIGDFVIFKSDGGPTFHFSVVVDDALMEISHVIRGEDHLSNTPKHILLYEAIEAAIPQFVHLPLILGPDRAPLSKRHGVTSIRQYVEMGTDPEALVNYLSLLGWAPESNEEIFKLDDLVENFSLSRLNKSSAVFDPTKLGWICMQHMKTKSPSEILQKALPVLVQKGRVKEPIDAAERERLEKVIAAIRSGLRYFNEVPEQMDLFLSNDLEIQDKEALEVLKEPSARELLEKLSEKISQITDFSFESVQARFKEIQNELGIKGKKFFLPIRVALTGKMHGPELVDVIPALGKERILKRLERCLAQYVKETS